MLSIVVVSYNPRELLRQCLASLERHTPAAQVIVPCADEREARHIVRNTARVVQRTFMMPPSQM